jgi:hypothetical protein
VRSAAEISDPFGATGLLYELLVRGDGNESVTLRLSMVQNATNDPVIGTTLVSDSSERRKFDISFLTAGNYTVCRVSDTTVQVFFRKKPPDGCTVVWDIRMSIEHHPASVLR